MRSSPASIAMQIVLQMETENARCVVFPALLLLLLLLFICAAAPLYTEVCRYYQEVLERFQWNWHVCCPWKKNLCWICLVLVAARFSAFCFFFLFCSFILLDPVQDSYCAAIVFVSVFSPACVPPPSPSSLPYCLRYTAAFLGLRCMQSLSCL